ncbi:MULTISPECIES: phage shock protein operon transcriptional activator [Tatumella]|uniref:Phage shock protein operon transcriptional activator n=1 Tax=Tatumella punctata TaxID=399969 RepID=A0ABW1VLQ0_9GAMM|nr:MULTISPECIES: phage shock protein operon transcriptional activator [unclassified Tatumella]MBS0856501.1 phage shock protein operon transcriptional activator [Tatumella sp. JGM16]MBS0876239.1 phage shock protein operon transcriptional activator [Tatumella sp. JGM82]MBS0889288.1 phage shock protein operon transcriptional activator [Tatumella sp. JGM94]MBS0893632.1 phage shock protein operon transcriptional activator [Tatumella sp. JGM130]MBS0902298.1 phage shock protein operon transcriptional
MSERQDNLLGESNNFLEMLEQVSALAPLNKPVLVIGERGTGKELIANRLHYLSARWQGPFVSLNCAALNDNLLDSELFGHEAGAFTGAQKRHLGRFERADGGTLFLDELATAPMMVQEKLLRVIEYGQLERVGGNHSLQVNVRLVCATNEDLPALAAQGKFRADLLDRLAFDVVIIPPLRERQSDILVMGEYFALRMCRELGLPLFPGFSDKARHQLLSWPWPGNVRELKNVIERSIYRHNSSEQLLDRIIFNPFRPDSAGGDSLQATPPVPDAEEHLPGLPVNLREWQNSQEYRLLMLSLQKNHYHQRKAAADLGLTYHQLRALIKKHQVSAGR